MKGKRRYATDFPVSNLSFRQAQEAVSPYGLTDISNGIIHLIKNSYYCTSYINFFIICIVSGFLIYKHTSNVSSL
jgi:hypothetical protein